MEGWQERVVAEKDELDERIARLREFLRGPPVKLSVYDRHLLEQQLAVMHVYSDLLLARIGVVHT